MTRDECISIIRSSFLFDEKWYLEKNQDVAAVERDAATHYFDDGAQEGRNPSEDFSTSFYVDRYPDVKCSGINPLIHYITIGLGEGREKLPDKYWLLSNNADQQITYKLIQESGLFDPDWYSKEYLSEDGGTIDPLAHYIVEGNERGFNPSPKFDKLYYLKHNLDISGAGVDPFIHYLTAGKAEGRLPCEPARTLSEYIIANNPQRKGLRIYNEVRPVSRKVFIVTDSIGQSSFFGGVGTALLFGTLLSKRLDAEMNIVVKDDISDLSLYRTLLDCHDIGSSDRTIGIVNSTRPSGIIPHHQSHIYIATSWWTARSLLSSVPASQIIYFVQEDERMFYPFGNMRLNAADVLDNPDIDFVVNSKLLFDHFKQTGNANITNRSMWFEPAFPNKSYYAPRKTCSKKIFSFYARPRSERNLFIRGLEAIERCLLNGVIGEDWEIAFIGSNIPNLVLPQGRSFKKIENVSWDIYLDHVRNTDLALSLMYTPHPSYPPIDVAACGGVVVTNTFGLKQSLAAYSDNILCASTDVESLVQHMEYGRNLALDQNARQRNFFDQKLSRNWYETFEPVMTKLSAR